MYKREREGESERGSERESERTCDVIKRRRQARQICVKKGRRRGWGWGPADRSASVNFRFFAKEQMRIVVEGYFTKFC